MTLTSLTAITRKTILGTLVLAKLTLLLTIASTPALAQTQTGCYPPSQSVSGPVAVTLWCQVLDYSQASPLSASWDTGLIPLQRGFTSSLLHIQYDPWYSAMDSVFQVEFIRAGSDIITVPIPVHYDGVGMITIDLPLTITMLPGDRIHITGQSLVPHTCNASDNCGMHVTFSFL